MPPTKIIRLREAVKSMKVDGSTVEESYFWLNEKGRIIEPAYCEALLSRKPMVCVHGKLYGFDGLCLDGEVSREILLDIRDYVTSNVARKVSNLLSALKIYCSVDQLPVCEDRIHFMNGTYFLDTGFVAQKEICMNRLPVNYNPQAAEPTRWISFLHELFYEDEIPMVQEFLGYCLIPTTRAQKMLLVIGNGGEGKSRIGRVMRAVFGDNMNVTSIQKLACDRFCRADQEGILVVVDDDMRMDALEDTNNLKQIVTVEGKVDLERKGQQSVQGLLYVRVMGFGNGTLSALYDRSDGFYRRQLVVLTKPKDKDRIDDVMLGEKLAAEVEGIVLWMLEGLHRLISQDFHFTISERTRQNMDEIRRSDNNIMEFYESTGYIRFEKGTYASTRDLYIAYVQWCMDNAEKPLSEKTFSTQLRKNATELGIEYDKNLDVEGGKKARGYRGVHVQINTKIRRYLVRQGR